jgi:hypothetical protein
VLYARIARPAADRPCRRGTFYPGVPGLFAPTGAASGRRTVTRMSSESSFRASDVYAPAPDGDSIPAQPPGRLYAPIAAGDRSCCCPSLPFVRVILPASDDRADAVDLLLCGHHYRRSAEALARRGADVLDGSGRPLLDAVPAW